MKRLKDGGAAGGERQFQTEVEMISLAVHRNLLRLYGFCMTPTEKLLVYPYMSNGSVASRLKGKQTIFHALHDCTLCINICTYFLWVKGNPVFSKFHCFCSVSRNLEN